VLPTLVIYDFDGTLCDTRQAIHTTLVKTFEAAGCEVPSGEIILQTIGTGAPLDEVFTRLSVHNDCLRRASLEEWKASYRSLYKEHGQPNTRLFAGVAAVLSTLATRNVKQIVISNKGRAAVEYALQALSIAPYIDFIVADQAGVPKKPDPLLYDNFIATQFPAINRLRTYMVGDSKTDLDFARNARLIGCWASYGFGDPAECNNAGFTHRLDSFAGLLNILIGKDEQ
jgi:phosphoglycolate phosphatase